MPEWIVVRNWERFQHYRDRDPVWIKNYISLLHKDEYLELSPTARALLHGLWLLCARDAGVMRASAVRGALRMRIKHEHLDSLVQAGFIEVSASKPLAVRARAREEKEKETPKSPLRKSPARTTGWRLVRGSHGMTYVPDPNGTDKPPAEARL